MTDESSKSAGFNKMGQDLEDDTNFMEELHRGTREFFESSYKRTQQMQKLVAEGQHPKAMYFGCMDARNVIEKMFGLELGDALVVRTIGNLKMPYNSEDSASIKLNAELSLALDVKGIEYLFSVNHSHCGAAETLAFDQDLPRIRPWLDLVGGKTLEKTKALNPKLKGPALARALEIQMVKDNYDALLSYPAVKDALSESRLTIFPLLFDMEHGAFLEYHPENGQFTQFANIDSSVDTKISCLAHETSESDHDH